MSNEPASASPFQEFLEERLKQLKDWGLFFKQRRAIVDRPEVLLGAKASIGWLSPVRYFLHGLAIIAVASNVLMFGVDQWISSLYNAKLVALYELAEGEQKKLDSTDEVDREAVYKKRDQYRAIAVKLEHIKNSSGTFLRTYGTVHSLLLPISMLLASYVFKLLFRPRVNGDERGQADIFHLYLMFSFCFWPIFLFTCGDLLWLHNRAYLETGVAEIIFLGLGLRIGWFAVVLMWFGGVWGLLRTWRACGHLAGFIYATEGNVFLAVIAINFLFNSLFFEVLSFTLDLMT